VVSPVTNGTAQIAVSYPGAQPISVNVTVNLAVLPPTTLVTAVANPGAQPLSAKVTARDQTGVVLASGTIELPAFGHRQFMLSDAQNGGFAKTQNLRGTVEFTTPGGAGLAVLGIRATAAGVITSIPVVAK